MLREHVDGALSHLPEYTIYYSTIFVVSRAEREDVYLVFIIQKNTYNQLLLEYCTRTVAVRSAHTRQVTGHFTAACRDRCEVRSPTILLGRTAVVLLGLSLRAMLCALPTRARRLHACSTVRYCKTPESRGKSMVRVDWSRDSRDTEEIVKHSVRNRCPGQLYQLYPKV